eukprot:Phypoly_transcript_00227.p1 GENE.Phypoly_transcript_00227~~Phypoly_transcript_00227.p1  ORF type:complete len:1901 (+),score=307.50 Phypoly_transcript_00227:127-5829(+)
MNEPYELYPPYARWKQLYHTTKAFTRHEGGAQEYIDELVALGLVVNFKNLLTFNAQKKNSPSRTEVQSGSVEFPEGALTIEKHLIPTIMGLADSLQLDEKYAMVLIHTSVLRQRDYPGMNINTVAEILYYEERKYQLMVLCELLKFAANKMNDDVLVAPVKAFFLQVGVDGLFTELLGQIHKLVESNKILAPTLPQSTQTTSQSLTQPSHTYQFSAEEMVLLSDALFYLVYIFPVSDYLLVKLLDYLLVLTTKLRQQPLGDNLQQDFFMEAPETIYNPTVFHAASALFTGITHMLFRNDYSPPNGLANVVPESYAGPALISSPSSGSLRPDALVKLNSNFMQFLDSYQPVSFHCGVLFAYLVFLDRNNPALCRENLTKISMALLNEPQALDTVLTILSEDAMFFMAQVLHQKPIIPDYDLMHAEGSLFYQLVGLFLKKSHYARLYSSQTAKPRAFFALFRFLASAYKASPDLGVHFWSEASNQAYSYLNTVNSVVERNIFAHEKFGDKIWISFLELMTNSISTIDSAYNAFNFLDKGRFSSDFFVKSMAAYVHDFNPNTYAQFGMGGGYVGGPSVASAPARPLSPADVKSWENILPLIAVIIDLNETVRNVWAEKYVSTVFQFLMCPVPISLKAKMLLVLAACAKSERHATVIWELLDQSDLISYAPDPAPIASSGQSLAIKRRESLAYELLWNESVLHEYPMTRAFLRLISELIKWPLPRTLGVGRRAPGAAGLIPYLAFITNEVFVKFSVRGYKELSEMWTVATECLSIMLSFLDNYKYNDLDSTDQYAEINGRRVLLPRHPAFLLIRDISSSDSEIFKKIVYIIEQGADKLINKRDELRYAAVFEQAVLLSLKVLTSIFYHVESAGLSFNLGQHLVSGVNPCAINLAKLVGYQAHTKIPLYAVKLLACLTKTEYGLARMFYTHDERETFITALADQLSSENDFTGDEAVDGFEAHEDLDGSLPVAITRFLLANITRDKPNVAQFYLGLMSDFGEPDLSVSNCFNTILDKLGDPYAILTKEPQLAEGFYELLYRLCADTDLYKITLEYLRDHDFFRGQLSAMSAELVSESYSSTTYEIFARSWLFKLVAIDIFMMSDNRTYVQEFIEIMFSNRNGEIEGAHEMITSQKSIADRRILQHLLVLDISLAEQPAPLHPKFNETLPLEALPRETSFRGIPIVDLRSLAILLQAERSQMAPVGDSSSLVVRADNDVYNIVNYFRVQNLNENILRGVVFFFSAWKQVIETVFYACIGYLEVEQHTEIILEILNTILYRTSNGKNAPFLSQMVTLVSTLISRLKLDKATSVSINDYDVNGKYTLSSFVLQKIFHQLLQTLFLPGLSRVLRGYLYASILDYLTITEVPPDTSSLLASQKDANSKTWFLEELANHYKRNKHDNYETIREFGFGPFLDLIATDAAGTGVDPWRAVALALLDKILRYDEKTRTDITRFLDDRGYLRALVDFENVGSKGNIAQILVAPEEVPAELLLYSGKVQFLQRIAQTVEGANLLWSNFLLDKMIHCQFIDYAPDRQELNIHQKIKERYDSLLNPVLELGVAMLLMLRKNEAFVGEFVLFLDKHSEVISQIIREKTPSESQKLITAIFYLLAQHQEIMVQKLKNKQQRFHNLLLQLLAQFKSKDTWQYARKQEQKEIDSTLALDTLNNLLQYCVCLTYQGGVNVIFSPQIKTDLSNTLRGPTPDMSTLSQLASHAVAQYRIYSEEIATFRNYTRDVSAIPEDVVGEIDPSLPGTYMTAEKRTAILSDSLHSAIATKDSLASKLYNILETTMHLLWHHLDHYILPNKTQDKNQSHQQKLYYQNYYHPANLKTNEQPGFTPGSSTPALNDNDIDNLREDARSVLYSARSPHPLLNQISEVAAHKKGSNVDVLVQKIKELIREPAPLVNR